MTTTRKAISRRLRFEILRRDNHWAVTVRTWLKRGWHVQELVPLIEPAMLKVGVKPDNRWRYYCGIIWQEQTELEKHARTLVDTQNG